MESSGAHSMRGQLRQLLRRARWQGMSLDDIEDEIDNLFSRGVDDQPAPTPDQLAGPT